MLPLTLFFIYKHEYSFSGGKIGYSGKDSFSFSETYVHNKNKQLLLADFSQNKYLIKPFLISTSETHKKI